MRGYTFRKKIKDKNQRFLYRGKIYGRREELLREIYEK